MPFLFVHQLIKDKKQIMKYINQIDYKLIIINQFVSEMGIQRIKKVVKKTIYTMDMFKCNINLRTNGEGGFGTIFGGIISITVIILLIALFYSPFFTLINYDDISASYSTEEDYSRQMSMHDVQIGFTVDNINLIQQTPKYFQAGVSFAIYRDGIRDPRSSGNYKLKNCNVSNWSPSDQPFIGEMFKSLKIDQVVCLSDNQVVSFVGYQSSTIYSEAQIWIKKCQNVTVNDCANQTTIDNYFNNFFTNNSYFQFKLYVLDSLVVPQSDTVVRKKLKKAISAPFSTNIGIKASISFGTYQITTDNSLLPSSLPNSDQTTQSYNYLFSSEVTSMEIKQNQYVSIILKRQPTLVQIVRGYGKVDQFLSYVGGLLGLVISAFSIFTASYSQYCYELSIGQALFKHAPESRSQNFNFFYYLGYQLYSYLLIFGINLNWHRMRSIHQARQQTNSQMDVGLIMKKLNYMQRVNEILLDEHHRFALYLAKPQTIQSLQRVRQVFEYSTYLIENLDQLNYMGNQRDKNNETDLSMGVIGQQSRRNQVKAIEDEPEHLKKVKQCFIKIMELKQENQQQQKLSKRLASILIKNTKSNQLKSQQQNKSKLNVPSVYQINQIPDESKIGFE